MTLWKKPKPTTNKLLERWRVTGCLKTSDAGFRRLPENQRELLNAGQKVCQSLHSVLDFCCERYLFTWYLALADDCYMEVPVGICLPAAWVLLLLLIFWSKQWNYANYKKPQLLGSSEKMAKYGGI